MHEIKITITKYIEKELLQFSYYFTHVKFLSFNNIPREDKIRFKKESKEKQRWLMMKIIKNALFMMNERQGRRVRNKNSHNLNYNPKTFFTLIVYFQHFMTA